MKTTLLTPFFISSVIMYALVRIARVGWFNLPDFINNYLTDLLCMPIILTVSLFGVRRIKKIPNFTLSAGMIFGLTLFYAILFEFVLPKYSINYTADFIDVIMYFIGAIIFWIIWKGKANDNILAKS